MGFTASTTAALDALLTREGFTSGQGGETQVIYCARHDELSDRFPQLPQANAQPRGIGCCIDLVIDQHQSGLQVALEAEPLPSTLRALHLDEAAQSVEGIASKPLASALQLLVDVLPQLFRAARPETTCSSARSSRSIVPRSERSEVFVERAPGESTEGHES